MTILIDSSIRRRGREEQSRLRKRSGNKNFRTMDLAETVLKLEGPPWHWPKSTIAQALDITPRRLNQALKDYHVVVEERPKGAHIAEEHRSMLDWDIKAFEEFFLTFSGYKTFPSHIRPWIKAFLRERNLLLNVPPRHAKSTFFMVWIPIWLVCRDRNVQVLLVSKTHEFAQNWALEIAGQFEHNKDLIKAFGAFKAEKEGDQKWKPNSGTFTVLGRTKTARGAQFTVESRGMNGQVLGREADFVIVDDPTDQEQSESEVARKRELKHLREQVFTRAEPEGDKPGGRIAVVGQRVHLLDMYGELARQEYEIGPLAGERTFHHEMYPAVLNWDTRGVLWPERFSFDELMVTYARVGGQQAFETLFQQNPLPEGSALVTKEWIEQCKDHSRKAREGFRQEEGAQLPVVRVVSVDPSPTKWNGIVVGDLLWNREHFTFAVTEVVQTRGRILELSRQVDRIIADSRPDYFIFEESGFAIWLQEVPWFQEVQQKTKLILHKTHAANKNSMEYGVQSLAGDFEFARLSFPYADDEGKRMSDMLFHEALTYPDGATNDLLMALWFVKFNYKRLAPAQMLPTRVRGRQGDRTWGFIKDRIRKKDTEDAIVRKFREQRKKDREAERVTAVG